jgi:hypothetical protein
MFDENGNWIPNGGLAQLSLPSTPGGFNPNTGVMAGPMATSTPFGSGSWDALQTNRLAAPGATGVLGSLGKIGGWLGKNGQTIGNWAGIASQGIQAYTGLQQLGLAKDAFKFEKKAFKTNLANSVDSYNTQMNDRVTGRYYATEEERQAALRAAEIPQGMRG